MKKYIKDALALNAAVLSIKYNMEACKYDSASFAELESAVMKAEKALQEQQWIPVSVRMPAPEESTDKYGRFWVTAKCPDEEGKMYYSVHVGRRIGNGFDMEGAAWLARPIAWKLYSEPEPFVPQN